MPLTTHPPSGIPATPLILVHGRPKSGVTTTALKLSAADAVGRTFVFEVGGTVADQYQSLGPYEIVDLDGSWASFHQQLIAATLEPRPDNGNRNVIVIDTISAVWADLGMWVEKRARSSSVARERLAKDPNAAIDTSGYWFDAKSRWGAMMKALQHWDGIAVLCAHGDDTAAFDASCAQPYRIAVEKSTVSTVGYVVHTIAGGAPVLTAAADPTVDVTGGGMVLDSENPLGQVVDLIGGETDPRVGVAVAPGVGWTVHAAKEWLVALFHDAGYTDAESRSAAAEVWDSLFPGRPHLFEVTDRDIDDLRIGFTMMTGATKDTAEGEAS